MSDARFRQPVPSELQGRVAGLVRYGEGHLANQDWDGAYSDFKAAYDALLTAQTTENRYDKSEPLYKMGLAQLHRGDLDGAFACLVLSLIEDSLNLRETSAYGLTELRRPAAQALVQDFELPPAVVGELARRVRQLEGLWPDPESILVAEGWTRSDIQRQLMPEAEVIVQGADAPGQPQSPPAPATISESQYLPFLMFTDEDVQNLEQMLRDACGPNLLRTSLTIGKGRRVEIREVEVLEAGYEFALTSDIRTISFEGTTTAGSRFNLTLPLTSASPAPFTWSGPAGDFKMRHLGWQVARMSRNRRKARQPWVAAAMHPLGRLALSALAVVAVPAVVAKTGALVNIAPNVNQVAIIAAAVVTSTAAGIALWLDAWGKVAPRVVIEGWGAFEPLRDSATKLVDVVVVALLGAAITELLLH
jgi:hypothetical protein